MWSSRNKVYPAHSLLRLLKVKSNPSHCGNFQHKAVFGGALLPLMDVPWLGGQASTGIGARIGNRVGGDEAQQRDRGKGGRWLIVHFSDRIVTNREEEEQKVCFTENISFAAIAWSHLGKLATIVSSLVCPTWNDRFSPSPSLVFSVPLDALNGIRA